MKSPQIPKNEKERLENLVSYNLLDTADEKEFDDIVKIASQICGTPISLISLIDSDRQWFKAKVGLNADQTDRSISFCGHAINSNDELFEVEDSTVDPRFADNPLVTGNPNVIFYAGAPLVTTEGYSLGTLCVIDNKPRKLTKEQKSALTALSRQTTSMFQLRKINLELNESRLLYKQLVESVGDYVFEVGKKGTFNYVNPQISEDTGYSFEELTSMHYLDLVHDDDKEKVAQFYRTEISNREEDSFIEFRVKTKNSKYDPLYVGQRVTISFAEDGKMSNVRAIARNITNEVRLRAERDEKETLYKLISENAQDLVCLHDVDGTYTYVSPSVKENLGYEPEELLGKSPYDFILEEDKERAYQEAHAPLKDGDKQNTLKYRLRHKSGEYIWFESISSAVLNDKNEVIALRSSTRNIQTRIKQEEIINEQNLKLQSFVSSTPAPVAMLDRELKYLAYSEKWIEAYGLQGQQIFGKRHYDIFPEIGDEWKGHHQDALNGITHKSDEDLFIRENGDKQWLRWEVRPWYEKSGDVGGIIMLTEDITELKKQELELIDAKEKAEIASEAKANFLSVMSHEIRTPLNAVIGLSHILLQESPRTDQIESLKTIRFSSENLLSLVNDILDYNKIESGKIDLEHIHFNLRELVVNIKQAQNFKAVEKGIGLKLFYDQDIPLMVKGDPTRLAQIINNLLGNAIKFTHKGGVKFTIEEKQRTEEKVSLHFEITDSGIGISKENQDKIFDRFTQAESDITRHFGGTGLGLSITKQLLEAMGSEIKVESELGKGATFSFDLTLTVSKNQENNISSGLNFSSQLESLEEENIKILLVEDNKANQLVARKFLTNWGIKVDIANDGFEALGLITSEDYNLVLMDLQMPKKDGLTTTKEIRSIAGDYYKEIPILALTASSENSTYERVREIGMNDMITKPFIPAELYKKIVKFALKKNKPVPNTVTETTPSAEENELYDHLNTYAEDDHEFLLELVDGLVGNINGFLKEYPEMITTGNESKAKFLLHKMRNSLMMTGSNEIIALGEDAIRMMNNKEEVRKVLVELEQKSHELLDELAKIK